MEFKDCLMNRKSIRNFTKEKVDDKTIKDIITAGIYAPSACNFEAWKYIVFKQESNKEALGNNIAINAPYGILVVYRNDLYVSGRMYNDYYQSAAASIQNMLLYITSIGLGGVWICGLNKPKKIKKGYKIPKNFDVIGYIAFGHPAENENTKSQMVYHYGDEESFKKHKRRFNIKQVMCEESFYTVDGDCTTTKYPTKKGILIRNMKNKARKILYKKNK